ncbi:hypothetical protein XCR_3854 [Xanthomonas campestris pv. raphani 756C]|nr:hypothetical protein XCR_3854 [Xanthomonas campestris pv. raphani 756C]
MQHTIDTAQSLTSANTRQLPQHARPQAVAPKRDHAHVAFTALR